MKRLRILHLGKYYFPTPGGIETFLKSLAEGQSASGDQVTVLCAAESFTGSSEEINGVKVIRCPSLGTAMSQPLTLTLPLTLQKLVREHDVIHLHTPNPISEAAVLSLSRRIPVVISHHSDVVRQRLVLPFYRPMVKQLLKRADRVVTATQSHIDSSQYLPEFSGKCRVIPYGLEPADVTSRVHELAAKLRFEHGRFILFVGRLVGYKGVKYLIEAMREIDAKLLIIGEGSLKSELSEQAARQGVASRIHFSGKVTDPDEFLAHYEACELLVLPSISNNEAFGLVQVEAMSFSKPSVVSKLDSGIAEVQLDGVTGIHVPPQDPGAIASAVNSLLTDDAKRRKMGEAARARFEERFTRAKMVEAYRGIYGEIVTTRVR